MKMYKKPITEIFDLESENLMQSGLNPVSSGGNASDPGNSGGTIDGD